MRRCRPLSMGRRLWVLLAVVLVAFVFQVFLRYGYERGPAGILYRVDRLTQHVCEAAPRDLCDGSSNASAVLAPPAPSARETNPFLR